MWYECWYVIWLLDCCSSEFEDFGFCKILVVKECWGVSGGMDGNRI